jgi:hypothetical protein
VLGFQLFVEGRVRGLLLAVKRFVRGVEAHVAGVVRRVELGVEFRMGSVLPELVPGSKGTRYAPRVTSWSF